MTLTPVRIRGKRKASSKETSLALRRQPPKVKKSLSAVLASRALMDRSTLESLPAEILESILLYSSNLALPRSSHVIGSKLSNRATQLRFFIWAFHETWDQWFGTPATPQTLRRALSVEGSSNGDPVLQSEVLELPWADIDFILQAQQTWVNNHARNRLYRHSVVWEDEHGQISHDYDGGRSHFNARECFDVDYQQALKWEPYKEMLGMWGTLDCHPLTRIPVNLITGPWDDEKQRRLFWLLRGGIAAIMNGPSFRATPWEDKMECLRNSVLDVSEPNTFIINCLLSHNWVFANLPQDVVRKEVANIEKRLKWGGDTPLGMHILRQTRFSLSMPLGFS